MQMMYIFDTMVYCDDHETFRIAVANIFPKPYWVDEVLRHYDAIKIGNVTDFEAITKACENYMLEGDRISSYGA